MEDNSFISIDETALSDKSIDREKAQENIRALQSQMFMIPLRKMCGTEPMPPNIHRAIISDNIVDDELFGDGNQKNVEDQVVPSVANFPDDAADVSSASADDKRKRFSYKRDVEVNESEIADENEVFDDTITYPGNGLETVDSLKGNRRSQSLPDLVLSSPEYTVDHKGDRWRGKCSPDVVLRKSTSKRSNQKVSNIDDELADLKKVRTDEKPKFRRSVSFQEKPSTKIISPTFSSAKQKRDSYRKSSGYGTGDSKTSSLQSNASGMSREDSKFEAMPSLDSANVDFDQEGGMLAIDRQDSGIQNDGNSDDCSFELENENVGQSEKKENFPILSIFERESLNPSQSVNENQTSRSKENILPFGIPNLPKFELLEKDKEEVHVQINEQSSESPSLKFVQKKYCCNYSSSSSIPFPEWSPTSQSHSNCNTPGSSHIHAMPVPDFLKSLSSILRQTDDPELQRLVLETCISKFENMEEPTSNKGPCLLSDASSTSSTSPCQSGNSSSTAKKTTDENQEKTQEDMTVQNLELMSHCRTHGCSNKICNKVRMCIRGLETALEQSWSPDIPFIKTMCSCLWKHAVECDEPDYTCRIPWCLHLKLHMGETEAKLTKKRGSDDSVGLDDMRSVDDRTADDVFTILSRIYRTPVLTCQVIPQENPNKVLKFHGTYEFEVTCSRNIELLTSFGHFRNVFLSVQSKNSSRQCVLKRIQNSEGDNDVMVVYAKLKNKTHRNILQHHWLAEYDRVYHLCTEFLKGGTLEECLQMVTITPQRAVIYMLQILDAVTCLHDLNVIYLYWSCSNMLFVDTTRRHLKLCNLSLSVVEGKPMSDVGLTKLSLPPCIVPPELTENENTLSYTSDCWGAGCLFAEMLTCKQPWYDYRHKKKEELWKKLKSGEELPYSQKQLENLNGYQDLLNSCWKKNPPDRISLKDLKEQLSHNTASAF